MRAVRFPVLAAVCAVLALAAGSQAAAGEGGAPSAASNRASAGRDARALLARAVLSAGAVALSGPPSGASAIDNPDPQQATPDIADAHAWWRAPGTLASVLAFERAHAPAGSRFAGSGGGTTPIGGSGRSSAVWSYVEFAFPAQAGVLASRTLIVKATALGAHSVALRIDAQDVWEIPRSAAERIPAGVHEIDVSRAVPGRPPTLSQSVTDPGKLAGIVKLIDALPIVQPNAIECPMILVNGPTVTFTFRASAGGSVLAAASQNVAQGPSGVCNPMRLSIHGRSQTPLLGGSTFVAAAGRLLGLTLAASG
jgi:hypothetical protein